MARSLRRAPARPFLHPLLFGGAPADGKKTKAGKKGAAEAAAVGGAAPAAPLDLTVMQSVLGRQQVLEKADRAAKSTVDPTTKDFRFWKTQPVPAFGAGLARRFIRPTLI